MPTHDKLNNLVDVVKKYLNEHNLDVPFFIAGGSVFSTLNDNTAYNDIDVFLYNREDIDLICCNIKKSTVDETGYLKVNTYHETDNAITISHTTSIVIQFIKLNVGTPQEIFDTFDINLSKCAITSDYEIVLGNDKKELSIDTRNVNGCIITRYNKYTGAKKVQDHNYTAFAEIIKFLSSNYTNTYSAGYTDLPDISGVELIQQAANDVPANQEKMQVIHDAITEQQTNVRLKLFSNLPRLLSLAYIQNACDEYKLCELLYRIKYNTQLKIEMSDDDKRVKLKYAEYFI